MTSITPSPLTWTLRLKYQRMTVVLHVDPLQTLSSIKSDLLVSLHETCLDNSIGGKALPESTSEIVLGRPVNPLDAKRGWIRIKENQGSGTSKKGKGRAGKEEQGVSLKSLDIKDNAVLAFKWGEEIRTDEALDLSDDDGEEWDVEIPKYEDTFGVENYGDVGAVGEFAG